MSKIHDKICLYASENGVYFGKTVFQWKATRDTNLLKGEDIEAFIVEQLGCDPLHTDSVYVVEVDIVDGIISTDGMSGSLSDLAAYVFAVSKIYKKIGWPKESNAGKMVDTIICRKATDLRWIISRHSKKYKDGLLFDESFQKARILGDCELNLFYDVSGDLTGICITYIEQGTTVGIGRKMLEHESGIRDLINDIYSVIGKPEFAKDRKYGKILKESECRHKDSQGFTDVIYCHRNPFALGTNNEWFVSRNKGVCDIFQSKIPGDTTIIDRELFQKAGIHRDSELRCSYDEDGNLKEITVIEADVPHLAASFNLSLEADTPLPKLIKAIYSEIGEPIFIKKKKVPVAGLDNFCKALEYCREDLEAISELFEKAKKEAIDKCAEQEMEDYIIDIVYCTEWNLDPFRSTWTVSRNESEVGVKIDADICKKIADGRNEFTGYVMYRKNGDLIRGDYVSGDFPRKAIPYELDIQFANAVNAAIGIPEGLEPPKKDKDSPKVKQEPKFKKSEYNFEIINLNHLFSMEACMTPGFLIKDIDADRVTVISQRTDEHPEVYHLLAGKIAIRNTRLTFYVSENCDTVKLRYGTLDYDGAMISGGLKTDDTRELLTGLLEALGGDVD